MIEEAPDLSDYYKPKQYPSLMLFDHVRKFEYEDELELVEFFTWFTHTISREPFDLQNQVIYLAKRVILKCLVG